MSVLDQLNEKDGTALVLSGGATKSFYFHLGVLRALHAENVTSIVGSSAGAVLGAFIAAGITVDNIIEAIEREQVYLPDMDRWVRTLTSSMLFQPRIENMLRQGAYTTYAAVRFITSLPMLVGRDVLAEALDAVVNSQTQAAGFFSNISLEDMLNDMLPTVNFDELPIDLYITATDIDSNKRAIFNAYLEELDEDDHFMTGVSLPRAVRASSAIPGIFEPVKIRGRYYVDGEVKRTLSADVGVRLADTVIISHTYQPLQRPNGRSVRNLGWWSMLKQSGYIIFYERIRVWERIYRQQFPDKRLICVLPEPDDELFFKAPQFTFRRSIQRALIHSGEAAAYRALEREAAPQAV